MICECENIVNSHSITYVTEESEDLDPLTKSMFLKEIIETGIQKLEH